MKLLGILSLFTSIFDGIKKFFTPTIPAENWENKDLIHQDRLNGMSEKEILKNAEKGRYILSIKYPKPHINEHGQTIIENCTLWNEDLRKYGTVQAMKWVEQGKYNLTPEEKKIEDAQIELNSLELLDLRSSGKINMDEKNKKIEFEKIISESTIDLYNTEASRLWAKAREVDRSCKK